MALKRRTNTLRILSIWSVKRINEAVCLNDMMGVGEYVSLCSHIPSLHSVNAVIRSALSSMTAEKNGSDVYGGPNTPVMLGPDA